MSVVGRGRKEPTEVIVALLRRGLMLLQVIIESAGRTVKAGKWLFSYICKYPCAFKRHDAFARHRKGYPLPVEYGVLLSFFI